MITFEYLRDHGWVEKEGVMIKYSKPRLGWKADGTLIIGYHEYPKRVLHISELKKILNEQT